MLLDNPTKRIKVTEYIKSLIVKERQQRELSATLLAKKMERPQSWIAQIENGRTQTIKQGDLVLVFSKILDLTMEDADKFLSEKLVEQESESTQLQELRDMVENFINYKNKYSKSMEELNQNILINDDMLKNIKQKSCFEFKEMKSSVQNFIEKIKLD